MPPVSILRPGTRHLLLSGFLSAALLAVTTQAFAQTADQAWLRYKGAGSSAAAPNAVRSFAGSTAAIPMEVRSFAGNSPVEQSAERELKRATTALTGGTLYTMFPRFRGQTIVGTAAEIRSVFPSVPVPADLAPESYWLYRNGTGKAADVIVAGGDDRGALYGAFALLRLAATGEDLTHLDLRDQPAFKIRWVDEWDNPDGSIERGYAGRSIFFEAGNVRSDLAPVSEYGRLLASVGINGLNVNNVNAAPQLIDSDHLKQIARIADALRPWGVRLAMSVAIASPQTIGGLSTYDPLDPKVKAWWVAKANEIYALIPDFAGFTVKADSEGQPGPASFGRTPADAANTLASALAPHGGVVLYRAFVYNHHLDWHDPKADRARAAYDIFSPLDGRFAANVVLQIKEGPIDFQAREPVSPLFAGLEHTSEAMEVQITQEYTGQQRHLVYLAPMWKGVLDTDLRATSLPTPNQPQLSGTPSIHSSIVDGWESTPVKSILEGKTFHQPLGGMVGVAGIGRDRWLNSPLALANLYAFGRLAWNPNLDPAEIAAEWTKQTISADAQVVRTVTTMLMQSWPAYESYTGPLGLQTLTDITGSHYGPNIESSERNGWGQWHDANAEGVGNNRSVATGSGYAGQYPPELARLYENAATTPDNLLLFFHHVPYSYKLQNGTTVIQHLYDSHYDGAATAAHFVDEWATIKSRVDSALYEDVRARLEYQAGHAVVWRDAVVQYFLKLSSIPDTQGRAGHYPGRLEAEAARLTGYKVIDITPWEDASGGKAVTCSISAVADTQAASSQSVPKPNSEPQEVSGHDFSRAEIGQQEGRASAPEGMRPCTAEWTFNGEPGRYSIAVQYFDLPGGAAKFTLSINNQPAATWQADATLPSTRPNGDNSTRRTIPSIGLKPGDTLRVEGTPDGPDPAALDYIELIPARPANDATQNP